MYKIITFGCKFLYCFTQFLCFFCFFLKFFPTSSHKMSSLKMWYILNNDLVWFKLIFLTQMTCVLHCHFLKWFSIVLTALTITTTSGAIDQKCKIIYWLSCYIWLNSNVRYKSTVKRFQFRYFHLQLHSCIKFVLPFVILPYLLYQSMDSCFSIKLYVLFVLVHSNNPKIFFSTSPHRAS